MIKECMHCGIDFDLEARAKREAGGKINECAECVEEFETETAVKHLGLQVDDGMTNVLSIVSFESNEDRNKYSKTWNLATGFHKKQVSPVSGSQANDFSKAV